jgi:fructose/tagatose bisphosphate aldolase
LAVAKVNLATALKQACLAATCEKLVNYRELMNPHPLLGMGGGDDALVTGRAAVKPKVKESLEAFGFAWKAGQVFARQRQAASGWGEARKNRGGSK